MNRLLTVGLLALLTACGPDDPQPLVGTLERERIELAADHAEPVSTTAVREGDFVEAGQVLVRLDATRLDAQLDEARAHREAQAARLAELVRGPRREAIDEAKAALARAEAELERAERNHQRIAALRDKGVVSQAELDQAVADRGTSRARRNEAAARLESLLDGTTVEELDRARAELRAAEARVATLDHERDRLTIRAPVAGWVDALPFAVGERVPVGAPAAVMLAADPAYARFYLPETLRARVSVGQTAEVRLDGHDGPLAGRVRFISNAAAFTPFFALTERDRGRLAYLTEVEIETSTGEPLPSGLPVKIRLTGLE